MPKPANTNSKKGEINPFIETAVPCPLCGSSVERKRVKPRLYQEKNLDTDMRPKNYVWQVQGIKDIHPPLYYQTHCQTCHFSASANRFEEPYKDTSISKGVFKKVLAVARDKKTEPYKVVTLLSDRLDAMEVNHERAFREHLLAIYFHQLIPGFRDRDSLDLGRYSLRLGWLFRDISENPKWNEVHGRKVQKLVEKVKPLWPEVPERENDALEQAIIYYTTGLSNSSLISSAREEVEATLLISRIYMKMGDITKARSFLQSGKDAARKFEDDSKEGMRKAKMEGKSVPDDEAIKVTAEVRRMERSHDAVQNIFQDIRAAVEEKQYEEAERFLAKNPSLPAEQKREKLKEKGIEESIIRRLVPVQKKKKLLGLFG